MSIEFWILLPVAVFELSCATMLMMGFRSFRLNPDTRRLELMRADLALDIAKKKRLMGANRTIQEKGR